VKKSDLGIVMIHWMLAAALLGAAASGVCLWKKEFQPAAAAIFPPGDVGAIHIGLSIAVVALILLHFWYLLHKRFFGHIRPRWRIRPKGRIRWDSVNVLFYWALLAAIAAETVSGVLLTKLIDKDVLARVFMIERAPLLFLHWALVFPVLAFPIAHVACHWLDGRHKKLLAIFRPHVFPRGMSHNDIVNWLRRENAELREKVRDPASSR
jgi:cytochrome b subunit of formate dehydrogenase